MQHLWQFDITYPRWQPFVPISSRLFKYKKYRRSTENVPFYLVAGQRKCLKPPAICRGKTYLVPPGIEHRILDTRASNFADNSVGFKRNREAQKEGGD